MEHTRSTASSPMRVALKIKLYVTDVSIDIYCSTIIMIYSCILVILKYNYGLILNIISIANGDTNCISILEQDYLVKLSSKHP